MDTIRDIHYMDARFKNQTNQFQTDTSKNNFDDWKVYESWLIGHGRKKPTLLKQLGALKRMLRLYPSDNIREMSRDELIELNSTIVSSKYPNCTKMGMQLVLRSYLNLFADDDRKKDITDAINILSNPHEDNPDSDEFGKVISESDFNKICSNMPNHEFNIMTKVLYSTGMRITELYNIMPCKVEYVNKKLFGIKLPANIFGYKCAWIYTRGKRTKSKTEGRYLYYMDMYLDEFKQYIDKFDNNEYVCNYTYSYFLQSMHKSVEMSGLDYKVHPHMFRHTVATRLFKKHPDAVVKKIMNWSKSSNMSTHYSHINKQDVLEAMKN